ncbi:MAG: enolase N-terminal-like fold-containing protein, partial [Candidatus Bipolaricaulia bacterium]
GACGLAATIRDEISSCCRVIQEAGGLAGRNAYSLAEMALSTDALEAVLGVATINAIVNNQDSETVPGGILEHLTITAGDTVGMVGYFSPLVQPIRQRCRRSISSSGGSWSARMSTRIGPRSCCSLNAT